MEMKDWLTLIIPIVCNGIVIFVIQRWISIKSERRMKVFLLKIEGLREFKKFIDELLIVYSETNYTKTDHGEIELLEKLIRKLHQIIPFRDSHLVLLNKHLHSIDNVLDKGNQMIDALERLDNVLGRQYFLELRELLVELATNIDEEIEAC